MSMTWLANVDRHSFWAHRTWNEFASLPNKDRHLVIIPVFGFADHGMGLPLDAEELLGSAVIRHAVVQADGAVPCLVLPPVRFGLAPYPGSFFGLDAETALTLIQELGVGIKTAGFTKLVFVNTSPWNRELIVDAARSLRVGHKLQPFIVNTPALGFDFHPAGTTRPQTQAAVCHLLGQTPVWAPRSADVTDADFRPGRFVQPPPVAFDPAIDGAAVLAAAGQHLARLFADIQAHPSLGQKSHARAASLPNLPPSPQSVLFPEGCRARYLPAMTREEIEALPDKDRALVILPTGAIEQHGPHLPVGVDALLAQGWLQHILPRIAPNLPVYIAPPFTFGNSTEHTSFPGTLSLSAPTYRKLLIATARQLKRLGFRQLALLNTHGGNSATNVYTLREIQQSLEMRAGILGWPFKPEATAQETAFGFHAGEWETSLMLGIADELVSMPKAVAEYPAELSDPGEVRPEGSSAIVSWATEDISASGVMGDATLATREKGLRWLEAEATAVAQRIETLLRPP